VKEIVICQYAGVFNLHPLGDDSFIELLV